MKVWIVLRDDWEGSEIMGVYADREKATAVMDDWVVLDPLYKWDIECHEVEE